MVMKVRKIKMRESILRGTQFILGLDGFLHVAEFVAAVLEEAWVAATLTGIHSLLFFIAVYFIGHDHSHHQIPETHNHNKWEF